MRACMCMCCPPCPLRVARGVHVRVPTCARPRGLAHIAHRRRMPLSTRAAAGGPLPGLVRRPPGLAWALVRSSSIVGPGSRTGAYNVNRRRYGVKPGALVALADRTGARKPKLPGVVTAGALFAQVRRERASN